MLFVKFMLNDIFSKILGARILFREDIIIAPLAKCSVYLRTVHDENLHENLFLIREIENKLESCLWIMKNRLQI